MMSAMPAAPHRDYAPDLARLVRLAEELGSRHAAREARDLAARVADSRFYLATVGQFKRGKSTLINALLGESLLPTGVAPVTSAITIVRSGPDLDAHVIFKDGTRSRIGVGELHAFVTEAGNPGNAKRVAAVELFHPAPLLATGLCLVDTPGLGSVFEANAEETRAFVPHIDAALVVLGADPPIGAEELSLVSHVAGEVDQLVVVLNKADRLTAADLAEARRFTERVLARELERLDERVYEVSAAERLAGGPTRDWLALETRLGRLASRASAIVERSARRGLARLARRLSAEIDERESALACPLEECERRIARLESSVERGTRLLTDLSALLRSTEERIVREFFDTVQQRFVADSRGALAADVQAVVSRLAAGEPRGRLRQSAYDAARELVVRRITAWLAEVEPEAEARYRQATQRFVVLANEFLASLTTSADSSFARLPASLEPEAGFRAPRQFYFASLMHLTGVPPWTWLFDRVGPRAAVVRAVGRRAAQYADRLLASNASRVTFDLRDRVSESRRALESELRFLLEEIVAAAMRALAAARQAREGGEAATAAELQRLNGYRAVLRELAGTGEADGHQRP